ncbi:MAG: hypothetical protein CFE26_09250 [Verrucomicrobiales bacterium VVV1]|nr:MAG: hypothetical protein CFE26_09250 [Verrucomicrobiales bacterium VVV1]
MIMVCHPQSRLLKDFRHFLILFFRLMIQQPLVRRIVQEVPIKPPMKFSSKVAMFGVVAGLSAAQVVSADEAAPEISICEEAPVTEDNSEEVIDEPAVEEEVIDEKVIDEKVIDEKGTGVTVTEEEVTEEDGEVPLDWVKRGGDGENPDVIFYNMAGGGPAAGPASNGAANDAGKDGAPTAVEAKTVAPVAPIVREKKGPVALVKGARVFLRH